MPVRSHGGRVGGRAAGGGRGGSSRQERETGKLAGLWNVRSPGGKPCNLHEHGVQQHRFGGHPNAAQPASWRWWPSTHWYKARRDRH